MSSGFRIGWAGEGFLKTRIAHLLGRALPTGKRGRPSHVTEGTVYVSMVPPEQRKLKQYELLPLLRKDLAKLPGVRAFPSVFSSAGSARGEALNFALTGPDLEGVARLSNELLERLSADP